MSFADRAKQGAPAKARPCRLTLLLRRLPESEATWLRGMLSDDEWDNSDLEAAIAEETGSDMISYQTISRHRRGVCCRGLSS